MARCLSLAAGVVRAGGRVAFVSRPSGGLVAGRVAEAGHELFEIGDAAHDATEFLDAARAFDATVALVDHYELGPAWWRAVRGALPLAALDDVGRTGLGEGVDFVLNQNVSADASWYPGVRRIAFGPRYALLAEAFLAASTSRSADRALPVERVLVSLGGADPKDATSIVVRALRDVRSSVVFDVVIGPGFVHGDRVRREAAADARMVVHEAPRSLAPLMDAAQFAVTGAGSTTYELAFLGIPAVLVEIADNQAAIGRGLDAAGVARFLGRVEDVSAEQIAAPVRELLESGPARARMADAGRRLVDGGGADRVAALLASLAPG